MKVGVGPQQAGIELAQRFTCVPWSVRPTGAKPVRPFTQCERELMLSPVITQKIGTHCLALDKNHVMPIHRRLTLEDNAARVVPPPPACSYDINHTHTGNGYLFGDGRIARLPQPLAGCSLESAVKLIFVCLMPHTFGKPLTTR